jgi:hypothetical protein
VLWSTHLSIKLALPMHAENVADSAQELTCPEPFSLTTPAGAGTRVLCVSNLVAKTGQLSTLSRKFGDRWVGLRSGMSINANGNLRTKYVRVLEDAD